MKIKSNKKTLLIFILILHYNDLSELKKGNNQTCPPTRIWNSHNVVDLNLAKVTQ